MNDTNLLEKEDLEEPERIISHHGRLRRSY